MTSFRRSGILSALLLLAATNVYPQWKLTASSVITPFNRPYNSGGVLIFHDGILWAGFRDVWMSADTGRSWSKRTPFDGFSNNSCIIDINFYNDRIGLATTQNGEIYITQDQGLSWVQHIPPNPFRPSPSIVSACFAGTPNNIIACTYAGDRYVSNDGGISWAITLADSLAYQVRQGSGGTVYLVGGFSTGAHLYETNDFGATWLMHPGTFNSDSYSFERDRCDTTIFYVVNDDLAAKSDKTSRIFISSNSGTSWSVTDRNPQPYHCGSITSGPNTLFVQTFSGISRSTDKGSSWKDIGGPPNIVDTRFVTAIDNNIIAAVDDQGSVWVTNNSGGDSLSYADGSKLSIQTADKQSDTIGGSVAVPIGINGIISPIDVELVMHYDPQLIYNGTFGAGNVKLDIAGQSWIGRSRIHIPNANSSGILAYSYFDIYNDSSKKTSVTFDSVIFCMNYLSAAASSTITPPAGCVADILTRFIRNSTMPQFGIMPNPASGVIAITSSRDLGEANVAIYDMLGTKHVEKKLRLGKNAPARLDLTLPSGVYSVQVRSLAGTYDLRVVVSR